MNWELLGGIAAGVADAKRQADQDRDLKEYQKDAKELRRAQIEELRRRRESGSRPLPMPGDDPAMERQRRTDAGADMGGLGKVPYADGGMIGGANSEMSDWDCRGFSSDLWQKQSFKK